MRERNLGRVNEKYQGMLAGAPQNSSNVSGTDSATEEELQEMSSAEQWSLQNTADAYRAGGNQGDWDPSYHQDSAAEPQRQGQS